MNKPNVEAVADNVWFRLTARGAMILCGLMMTVIGWLAPQWFDQKLSAGAAATASLTYSVSELAAQVKDLDTQNRAELQRIGSLEVTGSIKGTQRDKQFEIVQATLDKHSQLFNQVLQTEGKFLANCLVRRYQEKDIPQMVSHLGGGLQGFHYRRCNYVPEKVSRMLRANLGNNSFFCHVLDRDGEIGGGLAAIILPYAFSYDVYAQDQVFYIREGFHGIKNATSLIKAYVAWASSVNARAARLDQSTGFKMDKFVRFMNRQGFAHIGATFMMELP